MRPVATIGPEGDGEGHREAGEGDRHEGGTEEGREVRQDGVGGATLRGARRPAVAPGTRERRGRGRADARAALPRPRRENPRAELPLGLVLEPPRREDPREGAVPHHVGEVPVDLVAPLRVRLREDADVPPGRHRPRDDREPPGPLQRPQRQDVVEENGVEPSLDDVFVGVDVVVVGNRGRFRAPSRRRGGSRTRSSLRASRRGGPAATRASESALPPPRGSSAPRGTRSRAP